MDEQEQRTNMIKKMFIEEKEETSIVEKIEEFEDKIDYLDYNKEKKKKLREICQKIKEESSDNTKEVLFKLLQKELENQE